MVVQSLYIGVQQQWYNVTFLVHSLPPQFKDCIQFFLFDKTQGSCTRGHLVRPGKTSTYTSGASFPSCDIFYIQDSNLRPCLTEIKASNMFHSSQPPNGQIFVM